MRKRGGKMTHEELRNYDGKEGRKAYVAYKGKVYDVTDSSLWKKGEHQGMHIAGSDLTEAMLDAPHGEEVFEGFSVVADLVPDPGAATGSQSASRDEEHFKSRLREWYRRYHPHPATVHFPIALHLFAAAMDLLFFIDPRQTYAATVFYTFFAATLGGLVAMIPGTLSWWVNYAFAMTRPLVVKASLSVVTLLLGVIAIILYLEDPQSIYRMDLPGIAYHAIVLFTGFSVIVIGYYGGKLTWPENGLDVHSQDAPAAAPAQSQAHIAATLKTATPAMQPLAATHEETSAAVRGDSIAILIGGAAGTGIQTLETLLSDAFRRSGFYLFATKEYMSRVRGGSNTTLIRIGDVPLQAPCWTVDLFVAIDAPALEHGRERCGDRTLILADESVAGEHASVTGLPMKERASKLGNPAFANSVAAGAVFGVLGLNAEPLRASIRERFAQRNPDANLQAAEAGYEAGAEAAHSGTLPPLPAAPLSGDTPLHLLNGSTAVGFGFMAGGCDFVAAYPMSPSTGVLAFLASMSESFEMVVEQSEDEIAALNMVLGAWYAGARAAATTSGGGFALMGEAISLAGMTESPAVIYLAQRPGPATGLPTRSEQGDLELAIYSGHGYFPRIVLAPGSVRECIEYGYLAFELADRFQLPVIVLCDQYLADSIAMTEHVDFQSYEQRRYIVETDASYRRYAEAQDGISPRGIPGVGTGLVWCVSDEHDEESQITEDHHVRDAMVGKRKSKEKAVVAEAHAPQQIGEGSIAVVGWGSSKGVIAEALGRLDDTRLFQLHFPWVHPLNRDHLEALRKAESVVVVENNVTGAFASLLEHHGVKVARRLLQSNGFAFFADELEVRLAAALKELP